MDCPICNMENPEQARRCVCGYDFETGQIVVPARYPILRLTAGLLRFAGWLVLLAGISLLVVFIINKSGYLIKDFNIGRWSPRINGLSAKIWLRALGTGIMMVAGGELLAALVALERNTRQTGRNLDVLWRVMQHH